MTAVSCLLITLSKFFSPVSSDISSNSSTSFLTFSGNIVSTSLMLGSYFSLFIIGAIRYMVGIDYVTYSVYQIPHVLADDIYVKVEPLYKEVIKVGFALSKGMNYQYVFILTQFIIIFFMALAIEKSSKMSAFSIFIFVFSTFYAFSLSGMRQSISIAIFLYAATFIEEKYPYKYITLILVASLFHKFALVYLGIYFFKYVKMNMFYCLISVPGLILISNFLRKITIFLSNKLNFYPEYFGGVFDTGSFKLIQLVYVILISIMLVLMQKVISPEAWERNRFFINLQGLLTVFMGIITVIPTPSRIIYALLPIHIILIPNLIKEIENKSLRVAVLIVFVVLYFIFFYNCILKNNFYGTLPFKMWNF